MDDLREFRERQRDYDAAIQSLDENVSMWWAILFVNRNVKRISTTNWTC